MNESLDHRYLPLIFDSSPLGIFTIDADGHITSFNRAAETITGHSRQEALGRRCYEIFRADVCQQDCPLKRSIRTGETTREKEVAILTQAGDELPIAISTAALLGPDGSVVGGVEMFRDLSQVVELRKKIAGTYVFEDIVSKNAAMRRILERLPLLAQSPSTVLIEGASGTGKELVARALHTLGSRRQKPFVAVSCAALPDNLLESELFGYARGAFTDAKNDKPGRFALADGGTLFLDEIGEISPAMQVKLLRVLQEREFEPLGATKPLKVDVRIIAATNKDLAAEVAAKRFREDLYYRLNVVRLVLPSLAERREDIPLLVEHFIRRFNALQSRAIRRVSERALAALMDAPYPGNVRELENAVEHAFVLCQGDVIDLVHLPPLFETYARPAELDNPGLAGMGPLQAAEAQAIAAALARHGGNRTKAAQHLGLSRNTLWRKMKQLGLLP
ncbi:MAG: PAS domain S-box protein [Myxococcales bacterium]|nr:MAG: PAS domain S-box protein [Myxococcales bacterium]